jgi:hypothetical protein
MKTRKKKIIFHKLKKEIAIHFPFFVTIYRFFFKRKKKTFSGWGLNIYDRNPPWIKNSFSNKAEDFFIKIDKKILELVKKKKFILSQFSKLDNNYRPDIALKELRWRHYIICYTINYLCKFTIPKGNQYNLVELGVHDGMSAFFAASSMKENNKKFKFFLYDSWSKMLEKYLTNKELKSIGSYHYLDFNNVVNNLTIFKENTIFNKGYIPDSFLTGKNPETISWLHIDLNSCKPTIDSLNFFFDKIIKNGIIIFDDYGYNEHLETKIAIDKFLSDKKGTFFHIPTGQGIFYKSL